MRFQLSTESVHQALRAWSLPAWSIRRLRGGITCDAFLVTAGRSRYVAKFAYDSRPAVETGLRAAELVELHSELSTGGPLLTSRREMTQMVEGPPGKHHPLALLRFVPGRPLHWRSPPAPHIVGQVLGTVHHVLSQRGFDAGRHNSLFAYLNNADPAEPEHVRAAVAAAVDAVRTFEATTAVTYGATYGDGLDIRIDMASGRLGLIDWGVVSWAPLLFDVAMAARGLRAHGWRNLDEFLHTYLQLSPMPRDELHWLALYERLYFARQARFHAFRVARGGHYGGDAARRSALHLAAALRGLDEASH